MTTHTAVELQLRAAITMLENYATSDERQGHVEDAFYARERIENMKRTLTAANTNADYNAPVARAMAAE